MSDKRKAKEIIKKISAQKRRVASNLGKKIEKKEHLFSILIPIFAGLLFFILSIINLTSSIWFDEAYSAYIVRGDFGQIWDMTSLDVHPPFFYFALKMWSSVFGTSDIAMRFMSVFFGLIAIVFIFHLLKRFFGIKAAGLGTIFAAISPLFIRYGQEMRMYTMVLAIVMAATYFLSLALDNAKEKKGRKYFVIYAILIAIGMWTHYFSAFAWIAHVVAIIVHFGGFKKLIKNKIVFKRLIFTYVFAVLLFVPWVPSFFKQIVTVQSGFWIPPVSFGSMADFIAASLFYNTGDGVESWAWVFGIALIVVFIVSLVNVYKSQKTKIKSRLKYLLVLTVVPIITMIILSLPPLTSMFLRRYVLYSIIMIWVLFGVVVILSKDEFIKNILAALVIVVAIFGNVFVETRDPEGDISNILAETFVAADEGEPIVMDSIWSYYDGIFYTSEKHPIYLFNDSVNYEYGSQEPVKQYHINVVDNKEDFLKDHRDVWYVFENDPSGEIEVPEWAKEMRIVSEIVVDRHTAIKFTQD
jgi:4-amino-4-deoxy-L-arabinose transferase-like glycosyltransferase